jgi:hypothetical protein
MNIAGVTLSKANADKIATAALAHATEQGYCDEVEGFLEALGFDLPTQTKTVTITMVVSATRLDEVSLGQDWKWNIYHDDDVAAEVTKVSVK